MIEHFNTKIAKCYGKIQEKSKNNSIFCASVSNLFAFENPTKLQKMHLHIGNFLSTIHILKIHCELSVLLFTTFFEHFVNIIKNKNELSVNKTPRFINQKIAQKRSFLSLLKPNVIASYSSLCPRFVRKYKFLNNSAINYIKSIDTQMIL